MISNNNNNNNQHLIDQVPLSPVLHKTASAEKLFQTHIHEPSRHRFFIKSTEITRAILEGIEEIEEFEELQDILHLFQIDASKKRFGFPGLEVAIENFEEYIRGRGDEQFTNFDFYQHLLPKIAQFALEATENELIERLPLIEMNQHGSFTIKPKDVRCILANAFFLNISSEIHSFMQKDRERDFGVLDFNRLYVCRLEESIERIICQLSYFFQQANFEQQLCTDREDIIFTRHNVSVEEPPNWAELTEVDFANDTEPIIKLHDGRMEDIVCRGFVDFANRFIHIGSIIPSLTQEEVLFSCCPESFLTLLICESLSDTEVMTMKNVIRYSEYKGYLNTFQFTGLYEQPRGHKIDIIIMDATPKKHFQPEMIKRDLNKAFLGFKNAVGDKEVTSGKWGCGAFFGDPVLKFVQQLCAAKMTGKTVYYSTFKDENCFTELSEIMASIISSKITISELYYIMSTYHEYRAINSKALFIDYLRQELQRKK